jgi:hypothetical protein
LMCILRQSTSTTLRTYSSVRSALEARSGWICLRPHFAEFLPVKTYEEVYAWNEHSMATPACCTFHFQTIIVILEIAREVVEPFFFFFFCHLRRLHRQRMVEHGIYLFYLGLFVLLYICVLNKIKSIASLLKTTIEACQNSHPYSYCRLASTSTIALSSRSSSARILSITYLLSLSLATAAFPRPSCSS